MTGRVLYKSSVSRDLKRITSRDKERILKEIEDVLGNDWKKGEPLHGEFEGLFKMRIGDYRVIYVLAGPDVLVLRIRHRSKAYGS